MPGVWRAGPRKVLLLGSVLPRRADTTAVIGTVLLARAGGAGYRGSPLTSGARPPRSDGWLRSVRGDHIEWLRAQGVAWIHRVECEVFPMITPAQTARGVLRLGPRSAMCR